MSVSVMDRVMKIIKTPITNPVEVSCPGCRKLVASVDAHIIDTPDSKLWTRFGQPIKAPWAGATSNSVSGAFLAWDFCTGCGAEYDVARGDFIKRNHKSSLFQFDPKKSSLNNFECRLSEPVDGVPDKWLLFEYVTPVGKFHSHRFGPFPCARDYRRAISVLQKVWTAMRQLNLDESQEIINERN